MALDATIKLNDGTYIFHGNIWAVDEAERLAELIKHGAIKEVHVWQWYKGAMYPFILFTEKRWNHACTEHPDFFGPNAYKVA